MNTGEKKLPANFYEPVSTQSFALTDGLFRGQGVANDGEHFYFSYNLGIMKTEIDATTVIKQKAVAIPLALILKGCNHIGDISYMNGFVYATTEDSGKFNNLYLLKFDAETLECVAYNELPYDYHENGAPWCVADKENNVIYAARRDYISQLNVYDPDTLEFKGTVDFKGELHKVQGGDMYQGILYLTINRNGQTVFAVNLKTGESQIAFNRNLNEGSEGEGLTLLPMPDGSLIHALDIGKPRVGVHFRHYAFDPSTLEWAEYKQKKCLALLLYQLKQGIFCSVRISS